ncbi:MAG: hypothetical protein NTX42_02285 [Methanothrix sp.]|nr:hypothetical protein [Methanothrix sp.]
MDHKLSITECLAGSIQLDDQKLIDEIIESEIWDYDDNEATAPGDEEHHDHPGECHNIVDAVRLWQSQNPGKGDYSKERSSVCDLGIDEIFQGIERMKKEKTGAAKDDR